MMLWKEKRAAQRETAFTLFSLVKSAKYFLQSLAVRNRAAGPDFGFCSVCGHFSKFTYREGVTRDSETARSCEFDEAFREVINIVNSFRCVFCFSRYRVRCAASSLLQFFWHGRIRSIRQLAGLLNAGRINEWRALETSSVKGVFTLFGKTANVTFSEYFEGVPRGENRLGIRSEDLENLQLESGSLDALIVLDVFEHVADPWKAFEEAVFVYENTLKAIQ